MFLSDTISWRQHHARSRHMPASMLWRAEESRRATAHSTTCRLCRSYLYYPLLACSWASRCLWSLFLYFEHKCFTVFCWVNDNELQSRSLLTSTLSWVAILSSMVWKARRLSSLIRRDTVPEPWLPTIPSTDPRYAACLQPPWLWGMLCIGCCLSFSSAAALPASSCCQRSGGKPELTILTTGVTQAEHKSQSPPRVACSAVIKQSNEFSECEPEVQPQCRSFHALREGGSHPRRIFPSKVKESVPFPSQREQEGGEDNSANGTSCHRTVLRENLVMLSHSHTLPEPIATAGSGCHAEQLFYSILLIYLKTKLLSAYDRLIITTLCLTPVSFT